MAAMMPEASKSSVRSDGSGEVTIKGFSDSKKVTRTFLLGSDLHSKQERASSLAVHGFETWLPGLRRAERARKVRGFHAV